MNLLPCHIQNVAPYGNEAPTLLIKSNDPNWGKTWEDFVNNKIKNGVCCFSTNGICSHNKGMYGWDGKGTPERMLS